MKQHGKRKGLISSTMRRGRRAILRRAALCGGIASGVRALIAASLLATLVLALALLPELFEPFRVASGHARMILAAVGAFALACGIAGALLAALRAGRRWPSIWDRAEELPQTMETAVEILRRGNPSPWAPFVLAGAARRSRPGRKGLRAALPQRVSPALLLLATAACGGATLLAVTPASPRTAPAVARRGNDLHARVTRALHELAVAKPGLSSASAALEKRLQDVPPGDLATTLDHARALIELRRERLRNGARARADAARLLEPFPDVAALAAWLRGAAPAPPATSTTGPGGRAALERAAALLRRSAKEDPNLLAAANWLAARAAGKHPGPAPDLASLGERWRRLSATLEVLRAAADGLRADLEDAQLAEGGGDRPTHHPAARPPASPPPAASAGDTPHDGVHVEGVVAAITKHLPEKPPSIAPGGAPAADAGWQHLLGRLQIEERWIPVVRRYQEIHRAPTAGKEDSER